MDVKKIIAAPQAYVNQKPEEKPKKSTDILSSFNTKVKNSADMTDTLVVPRTIFKGYLGIMMGTTLGAFGGMLSKKAPKISKGFNVAGLLTGAYGTWAFVRPYIVKDAKGVSKK